MTDKDPAAGGAGDRDELGDDAGLADAGVATEQHGVADCLGSGIESQRTGQLGELAVASEDRRLLVDGHVLHLV